MNKTIINIFLILIICGLSYSQIPNAATCTNDPRVIEAGKQCNGTGDSCALGYYCPASGGMCTKTIEVGKDCTNNLECSPYFCTQGKCGVAYFSIAGETCTVDSDCVMGTQLKCIDSKCALPSDVKCKVPSECGYNQNCVNSVCVPSSNKGEACSSRYDCPVNLICSYPDNDATTKQCIEPWSKGLDDKCDNSNDEQRIPFFYDCDIGKNLYCGSNGKCVTDKTSNQCTQCNSTVACGGYSESCLCNNHDIAFDTPNTQKIGICVPQVYITESCKETFSSLIECCATNGCPMNQNLLLNNGSCAFKHCSQFSCQMHNCFRPTGEYNMLNLAQTACGSTFNLPKDYTSTCLSVIDSNEPNNSNSMLPSIIFSILFIVIMVILS